jgi:YD repeat-containing protein
MRTLLAGIAIATLALSSVANAQTWYRPDSSVSPTNQNLRHVRQGNTMYSYDSSGRLILRSYKQGNVVRFYDARGRSAGKGVAGPNGSTLYMRNGERVWTPNIRSGDLR